MKTLTPLFRRTLLTLAILGSIQFLRGQANELSKNFHFDAQTSQGSTLNVENKYGNITIKSWEQNKVVIDVLIRISDRDREKAAKLLSYINVSYSQEGNEIKAITQIDDKFNNPGHFFSMSDDRKFSIDYTISMPADLAIVLKNKYGNVVLDQLTGIVDLSIKYGDLRAGKISRNDSKPLSQISLGYSNGSKIDEVNWIKLDLKYSKLEIGKARAVVAVSKYSKLFLEAASSLVCEAKYDEYTIGNLSNFVGNLGYTDLKINKLSRKLDLNLKYGKCELAEVPQGFESLRVESAYSDVFIGIDPAASYYLTGSASYADLLYPEGNKQMNRVEDNTSLRVTGPVGTIANPESEVTVSTSYGKVNLLK